MLHVLYFRTWVLKCSAHHLNTFTVNCLKIFIPHIKGPASFEGDIIVNVTMWDCSLL
jgi:hypothetical protein